MGQYRRAFVAIRAPPRLLLDPNAPAQSEPRRFRKSVPVATTFHSQRTRCTRRRGLDRGLTCGLPRRLAPRTRGCRLGRRSVRTACRSRACDGANVSSQRSLPFLWQVVVAMDSSKSKGAHRRGWRGGRGARYVGLLLRRKHGVPRCLRTSGRCGMWTRASGEGMAGGVSPGRAAFFSENHGQRLALSCIDALCGDGVSASERRRVNVGAKEASSGMPVSVAGGVEGFGGGRRTRNARNESVPNFCCR